MTDPGFTARVQTYSHASGYEAELVRGDGTSTAAWGATEPRAKRNLKEAVQG